MENELQTNFLQTACWVTMDVQVPFAISDLHLFYFVTVRLISNAVLEIIYYRPEGYKPIRGL